MEFGQVLDTLKLASEPNGAPDRTSKHARTPSKHHSQTGTHAADVSVTE